jgi:hypothetical protein
MLDTEMLPPARRFPPERRDAHRARLEEILQESRRSRRWRGRTFMIGITSAALLGGGAAAARVLRAPAGATDKSRLRCYTVVDVGRGKNFVGAETAFARTSPAGSPELPAGIRAVDMCASLWSQGFLTPGANAHDPDESVVHPVPPLTACLLPNGVAAVFPAPKGTCEQLDLAELAE